MDMFDRLKDIEKQYEEIQRSMAEPDIVNDTEKYLRLLKEQGSLSRW